LKLSHYDFSACSAVESKQERGTPTVGVAISHHELSACSAARDEQTIGNAAAITSQPGLQLGSKHDFATRPAVRDEADYRIISHYDFSACPAVKLKAGTWEMQAVTTSSQPALQPETSSL
jgi:hypothetical protein